MRQIAVTINPSSIQIGDTHLSYICHDIETLQNIRRQYEPLLAFWAKRLGRSTFRLSSPPHRIEISAKLADEELAMELAMELDTDIIRGVAHSDNPTDDHDPGIAIAGMYLPIPLLDRLHEIFGNPTKKIAVFRARDQKQIALSQAIRVDVIGASLIEAVTNRTRHSFWELQRLDDYINTEARQLDPERGNTIITKWQGFSPITRENWREWECRTFSFRIGKEVYEVSETLNIHSINKPVGATMKSV